MSPHRGNMSAWADVTCQRGCEAHMTRTVDVTLGGPTPYGDLSSIPTRLARGFSMLVWDPAAHPVDADPRYCPASDAVSETIANLGVWSPDETALALSVMDGHRYERMLDFGAQIGWFSLLAASCGLHADAYDAEVEHLDLLETSATLNGWDDRIAVYRLRVDHGTPPLPVDGPVRFVKIDVEGSEDQVVRILGPLLDAGMVEHMLIEVTPVFDDYYPDLVAGLVARGLEAFVLPDKQRPPVDLADPPSALEPYRLDGLSEKELRELVALWDQRMVWVKRADAEW